MAIEMSKQKWDTELSFQEGLLEEEEEFLQEAERDEEELLPTALEAKLLNFLMVDGKKSKAFSILRKTSTLVGQEDKEGLRKNLLLAVANTAPPMKIRQRRRGSQKVKVPFPLTEKQRRSLGLRLILEEARKGSGPSLSHNLAREILEAAGGRGRAVERQRQLAQEAHSSRGNLFLRWSLS